MWRETTIEGREWHGKSISIHSLRVEGDGIRPAGVVSVIVFQSTPSVWRETDCQTCGVVNAHISIHSLRVEGDVPYNPRRRLEAPNFNPLPPCGGRQTDAARGGSGLRYFNPLPPCGGRRQDQAWREWEELFQSTPSVWRETVIRVANAETTTISIHSLRVEGDRTVSGTKTRKNAISIHSLRVEGDLHFFRCADICMEFQSTPSVWRETSPGVLRTVSGTNFNPLPPCGGRQDVPKPEPEGAEFQSTPSVWRETVRGD